MPINFEFIKLLKLNIKKTWDFFDQNINFLCYYKKKCFLCNLEDIAPCVKEEPECDGKIRWKKDCNWCRCIRGRAACSRKRCPGRPRPTTKPTTRPPTRPGPKATCVAGSRNARWWYRCNWCRCSRNGQSLCTRRGCLPGK